MAAVSARSCAARAASGQAHRKDSWLIAQGVGVAQGSAGVAQRGGGLAARGGGERLHDRDSAWSWGSSLARRSPSPARIAWAAGASPRSAASQAG